MGLLLLLALAGVAVAIAASQKSKAGSATPTTSLTSEQALQISAYAQIPPALVPTFVATIRSGDPRVAYANATSFRLQGYTRAADLLTQAADSVAKPPAAGTAQPAPTAVAVPQAAPTAVAVPPVAVPQAVPGAAGQGASAPTAVAVPSAAPLPAEITMVSPTVPSIAAPATSAGPSIATDLTASVPAAIPVPAAPAAASASPSASAAPSVSTAPAVSTAPTAPSAPPGQDPPLPAHIKTLLETVLRTAHDPAIIHQAADMLQANGFPRTAAELRKRAVAIASSQVDPIAIIQDILQQADQAKPPVSPTAPATSPSASSAIPPGAMPQYPSTSAPLTPWSIPGVVPTAPATQPGGAPSSASSTAPASPTAPSSPPGAPAPAPGISLNIPTQINVPNISIPPFTAPQVPPPPAGTRYYVVEPGDNPSKIAKKFTGNANRWREMATLNPEANLAAGKIYPGQRLRVPPAWPNTEAAGPVISVPVPGAVPAPASVPAASAAPAPTAGGYDPNLARSLAPQILQDVNTNKDKYNRDQLKAFQRAAGLSADGQYGPSSAGAVEYFASASAPPSLPKYGKGKKPYAPPRSTPPLKAGG